MTSVFIPFLLRRNAILVVFLVLATSISAQRLYQISGVEVDKNGSPLSNAWSGGFNNPLLSPIDLDQDGMMDLFIYDKAGNKAQAFINNGSIGHPSYRYAPEYDIMFPKELTAGWALIRDYNKDGVPDIFALSGNTNIAVWQGRRIAGGGLGFTRITNKITYTYGAGAVSVGIFVLLDNLPVIMDADNDGDLDIIAPETTGSRIYYHQNRSVELGYGTDSLIFVLADACWGSIFLNSGCGLSYVSCKTDDGTPPSAARDNGGAMYAIDYEGDHDLDPLIADMSCNSIKFMRNDGDSATPLISYTDTLFPIYDRSVKMSTFPAASSADVDNDGYEDMLISPFATNSLYIMKSEDIKCLQYYQNEGPVPPLNRFHYLGDSLLTPTTVDVGTESHAVFFDYNGDGLMDIVVGNFAHFGTSSSLSLYVNTGSTTTPKYEEVTNNWSGIRTFNFNGVYPAFGDMDGDGHADMVIGDQTGHLQYFHNTGTDTATYPALTQQNWFGISTGSGISPFIYDLNGDSLNDLIIGTVNSNIKYYWNFGTRDTPRFSADSVNAFLGRIKVASTPAQVLEFRSPVINKEGGQTYLYTGSLEGRVEKHLVNMDSLRSGSFAQISRDLIGISAGYHSTVSIADINGDGHNDYLTGNVRGGLMLFSDAYWGNGISLPTGMKDVPQSDDQILIYPVPARDMVQCRIANGKLVSAQMYNLLGEVVKTPATDDGEGLTLSVASLPAGIYIIQLMDEKGKAYQQKLSVMK